MQQQRVAEMGHVNAGMVMSRLNQLAGCVLLEILQVLFVGLHHQALPDALLCKPPVLSQGF